MLTGTTGFRDTPLAPQLPDSFAEMEPLFWQSFCGCNAGPFREALHEVYIPRSEISS
jgi:hypothetical protein